MKIAVVHWADANYQVADGSIKDVHGPIELHSVGWLAKEDDECITIAMELSHGGDEGRFWLTIPRVNVIEVRTIDPDRMKKTTRRKAC
jgi:hypothetical protein